MAAQKPERATQLLSSESAYQESLQNVLAFPGGDLHPSFEGDFAREFAENNPSWRMNFPR
jgi:hypothetical protein